MRTTNGALLLHNSSVSHCRGLSTAAGVYLESNSGFSAHLEKVSLAHCKRMLLLCECVSCLVCLHTFVCLNMCFQVSPLLACCMPG
jgi:hypothetical protein